MRPPPHWTSLNINKRSLAVCSLVVSSSLYVSWQLANQPDAYCHLQHWTVYIHEHARTKSSYWCKSWPAGRWGGSAWYQTIMLNVKIVVWWPLSWICSSYDPFHLSWKSEIGAWNDVNIPIGSWKSKLVHLHWKANPADKSSICNSLCVKSQKHHIYRYVKNRLVNNQCNA